MLGKEAYCLPLEKQPIVYIGKWGHYMLWERGSTVYNRKMDPLLVIRKSLISYHGKEKALLFMGKWTHCLSWEWELTACHGNGNPPLLMRAGTRCLL